MPISTSSSRVTHPTCAAPSSTRSVHYIHAQARARPRTTTHQYLRPRSTRVMGPVNDNGHPELHDNSSTTSPTSLQLASKQQGSQPRHLHHAERPHSTPSVIKSSPTSPSTTAETKFLVPVQVRTSPGCPLHGRDGYGSAEAPRGRRSQGKAAANKFDPPRPLCGSATPNSTEFSTGRLQGNLATSNPTWPPN